MRSPLSIGKTFFTLVSRHGLLSAIQSYWKHLREQVNERKIGIRSGDIISLKELGLEHEERREHYPTQFHHFRRIVRYLGPDSSEEVFLDYGAGLGRVVILAAMLPFKRVIGIELSPDLARRARENVQRCRKKLRSGDIEILTVDATAYTVPTDVTTIFFNNPFAGGILADVLRNIRRSHTQRPRPIRVVCNLPHSCAFYEQIRQADGFRLQRRIELGDGRMCLVFQVQVAEMSVAP